MKKLTVAICLTVVVLLGSVGVSYALPKCEEGPTTDSEVYGRRQIKAWQGFLTGVGKVIDNRAGYVPRHRDSQ
tara:strand:+ start:234 stop:452 length:219 start_codon:yes stop_codon:yes gene_type:complete